LLQIDNHFRCMKFRPESECGKRNNICELRFFNGKKKPFCFINYFSYGILEIETFSYFSYKNNIQRPKK